MGGAEFSLYCSKWVGLYLVESLRINHTAEELEEQGRNGTDLHEDQFALLQPVSFIVSSG